MVKFVLLSIVSVALLLPGIAVQAGQPENRGPATIKLDMGAKVLTFSHHKHQKITNNQCWECHDKKIGKIEGWSKATAHKLCIPCHDLNEKGPVSCKGCHKK